MSCNSALYHIRSAPSKMFSLIAIFFLQHVIDLIGIIPFHSSRHLSISSQVPEMTPSAQGRGDGCFFVQLYKDGFSAGP